MKQGAGPLFSVFLKLAIDVQPSIVVNSIRQMNERLTMMDKSRSTPAFKGEEAMTESFFKV